VVQIKLLHSKFAKSRQLCEIQLRNLQRRQRIE